MKYLYVLFFIIIVLSSCSSKKDHITLVQENSSDYKIVLATKSDLYAAYTFIEEYLGCRLLSVNEEFIPGSETIGFPEINKIYNPRFSFRRILFPGMKNEKYRNWHKVEPLDEWGSFVHTFIKLIKLLIIKT